jgi:putative endonuclease
MASAHSRGLHFETLAARFLSGLGYRIVARNWRCREGELDIVADDGGTLAFVEVRARKDDAGYLPEETLDARKLSRVALAAERYLQSNPWDGPCRFDVVAIDIGASSTTARLLKDAFTA